MKKCTKPRQGPGKGFKLRREFGKGKEVLSEEPGDKTKSKLKKSQPTVFSWCHDCRGGKNQVMKIGERGGGHSIPRTGGEGKIIERAGAESGNFQLMNPRRGGSKTALNKKGGNTQRKSLMRERGEGKIVGAEKRQERPGLLQPKKPHPESRQLTTTKGGVGEIGGPIFNLFSRGGRWSSSSKLDSWGGKSPRLGKGLRKSPRVEFFSCWGYGFLAGEGGVLQKLQRGRR